MDDINIRFIKLRKALSLTQKGIGDALGLSNSGISNIENGTRNVTDKHIKLLASIFNVSEEWMRSGSGSMFLPNVGGLVNDPSLDAADREILQSYIRMTPAQRQFIKSWIKEVAASIHLVESQDDDRERAHRLLDQELDAEKEDVSASTTGSSATEKKA